MHNSPEKSRSQQFEKHVLYGIVAIVCLAPLPFGSNRQAPFAIITAFIGLLSIYWGIFAAKDKHFVRISLGRVKFPAMAIGAILIWALIQAIPFNISLFSSEFWLNSQKFLPEEHIRSSISVNRHESWLGLTKILSYVILFWLSFQICRSSNNTKKILKAISFSGTAYATYGLLIQATGANKILWYEKIAYTESLTSTFVNRNSYATYAAMVLVVSIALFLQKLLDKTGRLKKHEFISAISERLFTTSIKGFGIIVIVASSLVLSASRAGIVSALIGIASFILLSSFSENVKKHRKTFAAIFLVITMMFAMLFDAGGDVASSRFKTVANDFDSRLSIYNIAMNAIVDFPIKGTGLGSFHDISKTYKDATTPWWLDTQIEYAHNSYLELMLELGIPAALLLFAVFAIITGRCFYGVWARKQNKYIPAIAASVAILVGFHSLFDFSAQIPAVMIIFTVILSSGLAQSWSKREDTSDAAIDLHAHYPFHYIATKSAVIIGIMLVTFGVYHFGSYFIETDTVTYRSNALEKIELAKTAGVLTPKGKEFLKDAERDLVSSIKISPSEPYAWTYLAYSKLLSSNDLKGATKIFINSISNGFYEQNLIFFRLKLIPILWLSATEDEQSMLTSQIKVAWDSNHKRTMETSTDFIQSILKEKLRSVPDAEKELNKFDELEKQRKR